MTMLKKEKPHRILREVYRHYMEFRDLVMSQGGDGVIEYGGLTISFWDLYYGLRELAPRKRQAVFWNVIMDQKQKDVAARMNITTVSVGQYVEQAMIQLSRRYFAELYEDESEVERTPRRLDAVVS